MSDLAKRMNDWTKTELDYGYIWPAGSTHTHTHTHVCCCCCCSCAHSWSEKVFVVTAAAAAVAQVAASYAASTALLLQLGHLNAKGCQPVVAAWHFIDLVLWHQRAWVPQKQPQRCLSVSSLCDTWPQSSQPKPLLR